MNIEERIVSEGIKLSEAYYPYYFKKYKRNKYQVYNKYKQYFEKIAQMFCIRENYNAKHFIEANQMDGFKFPQQMCNELSWKAYVDYSPCLYEEKSKEVVIIENLMSANIELKRNGNVKKWLSKKVNQIALEQNQAKIDLTLFSFSKEFNKYCKLNNLNYNLDNLRNNVLLLDNIDNKNKIINKIKSILQEDYYTYNSIEFINQMIDEGCYI